MKVSIRRKIILGFTVFMLVGGLMWYLNYYRHHLLNQKLQIIERKETLLNTILEARRYEKNYFLYLDQRNLNDAVSYIVRAEKVLLGIIYEFGRYTLAKDLRENLQDLRRYKHSLSILKHHHQEGISSLSPEYLMKDFPVRQKEIRELGKKITIGMEQMVKQERVYINRLIRESRIYHFIALAGIVTLSVFAVLFLFFNVNRPLKSIENAIHKIAQGDYENIPVITTGDEFESLVTSLNNMIDELNRRSEQLLQTEKMASLGTLTSGVAHELNNPLNNISTSVQILLEEMGDGIPDFQKELLRETENQVLRARDIVKALLEFSSERSFSPKKVGFRELLDQTKKLIKGEVPTNVEIKVDVPDGIQAEMDPRRIQQVLINLILNSVQAMQDGGVLRIQAYEKEDKQGFYFQVEDTGRGIPPQDLPKIFDPFFTTKEVGKGSGLGLSVSHGIIQQHGGRIEVKSEPGKGTTFTVFLPSHSASRSV